MRIPFTVIGGFLGAGKTSLLNDWLRGLKNLRVALLVNDFGELNIDADLIASQHGDTLALTNGCVCCSLGDDLSMALINVLQAQPSFEAVVVEASGVSDPGRIAMLAQAVPEFERDGVLVVVDANTLLEQWSDPLLNDTLARQLRAADILILNKIDLIDAEMHNQLMSHFQQYAPGVAVIETIQGKLPSLMICGAMSVNQKLVSDFETDPQPHSICDHDKTCPDAEPHIHAAQFETWYGHPNQMHPLEKWQTMFESLGQDVLRLKGFVQTQEQGWSEVQLAGRRVKLRPATNSPDREQAVLVAIGLRNRLPRHRLNAMINSI